MPSLTPPEVVALLETAQSLPGARAASLISSLPPRTTPHATITAPLLELLQVHPLETLPHIADLLPPSATSALLETLSTLLSDRRLLPPILGLLPSLPLSPSQTHQSLATLAFALDVVDADDLPAVLRTICLLSPAAIPLLRSRIRLTPDIAPVVAASLSDFLSARHPLSAALLALAPPPRPLDFLLLLHALQSRLSPRATRAAEALTRGGAFAATAYPRSLAAIATSLPECPHGAASLLSSVLRSARAEPAEIAAIARFAAAVVRRCPHAAVAIPSVGGIVAVTVQTALPGVPRVAGGGVHRVPEIDVHFRRCANAPDWGPLFISVRKGALFGSHNDFRRVERLSRAVVREAGEGVVKDLFQVLDSCVGDSPAEPLAVALLDLLAEAVMGGVFLEETFRKRVDTLPEGLLSSLAEPGEDVLQVDVGVIWEQRGGSVASVVSAAVTFMLAPGGTERVARGLLDVSVLVPVVCITLYQAVEDLAEPISLSSKGRRRSRGLETMPATVCELETSDLCKAVLSFGAGMATIVGLLNRSARWLEICRRVIGKRHEGGIGEDDRKAMWMVVDRLTEFDRMRTALALAMEVLQQQWNDLRPQKGAARGKRRRREAVREALERSQTVRDSILASLDAQESARRGGQEEREYDFPRLSLEATVLSLVSIPDEEGIESMCDENACKQTRDVELVRLDKLLLAQLVRFMTTPGHGFSSMGDRDDANVFLKARNMKAADWVSQNFLDVETQPPENINEVIPNFAKQLEEKDDIFFTEHDVSDDEAMEEEDDKSSVLWAPNISNNDLTDAAYIQSTVSLLLGTDENAGENRESHNVASLIHSPAFAAMLLDRATTYVAVARKARSSGSDDKFLSEIVMASGLALRCLNGILRIVSLLPLPDKVGDSERSAGETEKLVCEFLNQVGERLLVCVQPCDGAKKNPTIISKHLSTGGWKMMTTLHWIANTSVEAAVASVAIEGLLTLSEYDVCHKSFARQLAFSSVSMVYEYEGGALWEEGELDLVQRDTYCEWSMRRRRSQELTEGHADQLDAADPHPWIELKLRKLRRKLLERHRLSLYFSGMYVPDALIEGCGWIREISVALSAGTATSNEESTVESSKRRSREKAIAHRKSAKRRRAEPQGLVRKEVLTCDTLLDMIGFRTITELLIDVVVQGLQAYPVPSSLSVEDTNDEWTNPVPHLRTTLRLFCGLVSLYHENRRRLVSASRDAAGRSISLDLEFDYSMVTACIAVLQLTRSRMDELLAWYSNPSTDVSQLSTETVKCLEEVVGSAAQAVNRCSEVAESIKVDQGSEFNDEAAGSRSRGKKARKTPGYEKRARKRPEGEELSKARRMIPRLTGQSENVVKSLQKLARTIGIRAKQNLSGLAPQPVSSDHTLHFGIGLEQVVDDVEDGTPREAEDSEAGRSKTTAGMSSDNGGVEAGMQIEGFHARSGKADNHATLQETVTVNFGRSGR